MGLNGRHGSSGMGKHHTSGCGRPRRSFGLRRVLATNDALGKTMHHLLVLNGQLNLG